MFAAIINGTLREKLISPRLGPKTGHVASSIVLCAIIPWVAWISIVWIGARQSRDGWLVGLVWLTLTIAFEFLAGHFLFKSSWNELLSDYNIAQGRIRIFVPIIMLMASWCASIRNTT